MALRTIKEAAAWLALQLRVLTIFESMGDHGLEIMDDGCFD